MIKYHFLDLKVVNASIEEELKEAACKVISSGRFILGENVAQFEKNLAELCQVKHVVATSTGLDALRLILRAYVEMGVMKKGDEIIVPANTFVASALAVSDCGLVPVFADATPNTMNLDLAKVESYITDRTRGIMLVHLYGTPCWDSSLIELKKKHNLVLIEDNAQAIGAKSSAKGLNDTYITGGLGDASGISFYPTKNIGALGDAGAVTTNDDNLAKVVRELANYGSDRRYHNIYCGLNCRMDELQAAFLNVKLPHTKEENLRRHTLATTYDTHITNPKITKPHILDNEEQVWYQYVIKVDNRDEFKDYMLSNGVETDILYATPLHKQPCYESLSHHDLKTTEDLCDKIISLPISAMTNKEDAIAISEIINRF